MIKLTALSFVIEKPFQGSNRELIPCLLFFLYLCCYHSSKIVFKTAGVLLDELQEKGMAALKYKAIILDEVHERSVESDLVLVCVKQFLLKNDIRLASWIYKCSAEFPLYRCMAKLSFYCLILGLFIYPV